MISVVEIDFLIDSFLLLYIERDHYGDDNQEVYGR